MCVRKRERERERRLMSFARATIYSVSHSKEDSTDRSSSLDKQFASVLPVYHCRWRDSSVDRIAFYAFYSGPRLILERSEPGFSEKPVTLLFPTHLPVSKQCHGSKTFSISKTVPESPETLDHAFRKIRFASLGSSYGRIEVDRVLEGCCARRSSPPPRRTESVDP